MNGRVGVLVNWVEGLRYVMQQLADVVVTPHFEMLEWVDGEWNLKFDVVQQDKGIGKEGGPLDL